MRLTLAQTPSRAGMMWEINLFVNPTAGDDTNGNARGDSLAKFIAIAHNASGT
jgi:hypothetical protein